MAQLYLASELGFRARGWGFRVLRLWCGSIQALRFKCEVAGVGDFVAIAEGRLRFQGRKKRSRRSFPNPYLESRVIHNNGLLQPKVVGN